MPPHQTRHNGSHTRPGEFPGETVGEISRLHRARHRPRVCWRSRCCPRDRPARQSDREFGKLAHTAVDLNGTAMLLGYDVVADRESKSRALSGRLCREEGLKQLVLDFGWNAHAIIA